MDETRVHPEVGLEMCAEHCTGEGHRLHPIQRAVAASSPSSWVDGFAFPSGHGIAFHGLDGSVRSLWHHVVRDLAEGEPVAFHPVAGVLSVRGALLNVSNR
ncbi:hypothetical protein [Protaetiibacter larvae]|uniref:Uncharacterized protein n=1 Tax=Protaetiibacter larvae TaxID=2592654 RepID=A0A5C1Y8N5_9MICO|nr:hypothetical protein [Protaetiibacter larvae]QEO09529.1 hypothetical protein FLP23_05595 [Protaetiibacter larvae]